MNENETNPRPADAAADNTSAERVESEQPTLAQPPVAPQSGAPQSAAPHPPAPGESAPGAPVPAPQPPHSPWSQQAWQQQAAQPPAPGQATPSQAAPGQATPGQPASGQPAAGQPGSGAPAGQPGSGVPYGQAYGQTPYGQPGQPTSGQPTAGDHPTTAIPYGHQGYQPPQGYGPAGYQPQAGYHDPQGYQHDPHAAYTAWHASQGQPGHEGAPWARPVGGGDQRPPGRGRKVALAGAAAVLIALTAGGVGAATALAMADDPGSQAVQTGNSSVTRVVDRSSLAQIAAAVEDSVVSITTGSGEGSGVVISTDGYIVTNNHVVSTAQGDSVNIIFADGKKASASVVGTDPRTDLAVVKATGVANLKAAIFGDSAQSQVGDTVLALGSPLGLEGSVTAGIISAKDRSIESGGGQQDPQSPFGGGQQQQATTRMTGLLQTDAPINPGNSGGALVNTNGEVIGINSAIATNGSSSGNIGLGFAIPSNKARQVADQLRQGKKVSHPALGVNVTTAENGGALISNVSGNSAAAKAELQTGDVVTKVDGKNVEDADDLVAAVQAGTVGQQMTLTFTRNGNEQTVTVTLQEAQ